MNLKQLMYFKEKNGYTFEQLSELSGVPVGTIQKIFSGETRTPRHKTIQALEMIMKFEEKDEDSGYHSGDSHNDVVREVAPAYKARQGSYTLDDYFATPDNVRVELIDGVIYDMGMPSTVHQYLITKICHAIYSYIEEKGGHCMVFPASPGVRIDCDDRSMLVGIIHPSLKSFLCHRLSCRVIGETKVDHIWNLFGKIRHKAVAFQAGHVDDPVEHTGLFLVVPAPSSHYVAV